MSTNPIRWAQGRAERNRASVNDPDRVANINQIDLVAGRIVGRAADQRLLSLVKRYPAFVDRLIGTQLPANLEFAGASSRWTWVKDDANVITKIHRDSVWKDDATRNELAHNLTKDHATMRWYLGASLIEQTVHHDAHPFRDGHRAVMFRHPLVPMVDLHLFNSQNGHLEPGALEAAQQAYPGISDSLNNFAQGATDLYAERGLLADTSAMHSLGVWLPGLKNGTSNLVFQHGAPVPDVRQRDVDRIMGQLEELHDATY